MSKKVKIEVTMEIEANLEEGVGINKFFDSLEVTVKSEEGKLESVELMDYVILDED